MGEALINLVHQYPALWDKQDMMYKDSSYKDAKWKEIEEILHLTKEDVIKKWKSLRDTYVRHKNIKSKSGDGLSQCRPKWKYYDIMSFIDITLRKRRYVPIYLITSYLQQICMQLTILCDFDQIRNGHVCFNILVLCLMLLMRGSKIKVIMKGRNKFLITLTPR